jgi:hypothetical protein
METLRTRFALLMAGALFVVASQTSQAGQPTAPTGSAARTQQTGQSSSAGASAQAGTTGQTGSTRVAQNATAAPDVQPSAPASPSSSGGQAQSTTAQNATAYGTLVLDIGGAFAAAYAAVRGSNNNNNTTNTVHASPAPSVTPASPAPTPGATGRGPSEFRYDSIGALSRQWSRTMPFLHTSATGPRTLWSHFSFEYNGRQGNGRERLPTRPREVRPLK